MKTRKLFLKITGMVVTVVLAMLFIACPDGTGNTIVNDEGYFSGTVWSDNLDVGSRSYIRFESDTTVNLEGRYWNKYTGISGLATTPINMEGIHTYEVADDLTAAEVAPAVWILLNEEKRTGIELYLYKANSDLGKYERLVVYRDGILQPREFYLYGN